MKAAVVLALLLLTAPPVAAAPEWDPAGAISAYSAALNTHDIPAALALFDQNGSATDVRGRHYEGQAGLTEFLQQSGFGSPDAHIETKNVHIVGNRAVWTYFCSCNAGPTEVRMVMNHNKISVFAIMAPVATPVPKADPLRLPILMGLGLMVGLLASVLGARRFLSAAAPPPRRAAQGHLLTELARARTRGR